MRHVSICLFRRYISVCDKAEHLDPKFANESIANATKDFAGIGLVPTILVQNTSSEASNPRSVSDTVDTFSALPAPLKTFNSVVSEVANARPSISLLHATNIHTQVHPYTKAALSIFTCASEVGFFLGPRRCRVDDILVAGHS